MIKAAKEAWELKKGGNNEAKLVQFVVGNAEDLRGVFPEGGEAVDLVIAGQSIFRNPIQCT